jgi:hypothetical protein
MTVQRCVLLAGNPTAHPVVLVLALGLVALAVGLYQMITGTTPAAGGSGRATRPEIRWTGAGLLFIGVAIVLLYALVTGRTGVPLVVGMVASLGVGGIAIARAVQIRRGIRS